MLIEQDMTRATQLVHTAKPPRPKPPRPAALTPQTGERHATNPASPSGEPSTKPTAQSATDTP